MNVGDAIRQLRARTGRMAELATEAGAVKLDWVDAVPRLLSDPSALATVEAEARELLARGIRHVIWAGMGGSVMTVRALVDLGMFKGSPGVAVHPLDSTDPSALNRIVKRIATLKGLMMPDAPSAAFIRDLLADVLLVGVAMGMTSEEPITHLEWFSDLLARARLEPSRHTLVMALPGSFLERAAENRQVPVLPLQLDGGAGTPGRMSAPGTRVFLLPAALALAAHDTNASLPDVLRRAWDAYDLAATEVSPEEHPAVCLALALHEASEAGACRLLLSLPGRWAALLPWVEQLMEESLGKGGKGVVVFGDQPLQPGAPAYRQDALLRWEATSPAGMARPEDVAATLVTAAAYFLSFQLTTALYAYLQGITFAGQPAVEDYKARARALRHLADPLQALQSARSIRQGALTLYPPQARDGGDAATMLAQALREALQADDALLYLDLTINGEIHESWSRAVHTVRTMANARLGVPLKLRRAPAAYHSTEQSEMDGPPGLVSLRVVTRRHERCALGDYGDTFLLAQAVGTWQAMTEAGRRCFLLVINGGPEETGGPLEQFLANIEQHLEQFAPTLRSDV